MVDFTIIDKILDDFIKDKPFVKLSKMRNPTGLTLNIEKLSGLPTE
jgi:hypothetical protein